jgi:serine/threonine protein kinase
MIRSADGAPILLDFGASRFEMKQHSQLVSALAFKSGCSAPEQYTSNADRYGPWTDIYAFAATLYRAIAGRLPSEETARQLHDDQAPAAKSAKGDYREAFLKAIDWALRLRPQERPQAIDAWRAELLGGSEAIVTPARRAPWSTARRARRSSGSCRALRRQTARPSAPPPPSACCLASAPASTASGRIIASIRSRTSAASRRLSRRARSTRATGRPAGASSSRKTARCLRASRRSPGNWRNPPPSACAMGARRGAEQPRRLARRTRNDARGGQIAGPRRLRAPFRLLPHRLDLLR